MRLRIHLVFLCCGMYVSSVALAQPADVPARCKEVATVPADAKIATPATAAKIALASCGAEARFAELKLAPDDASIQALISAAKPSLDLYDDAIRANDATLTQIATKARADLLIGMAIRMRNSIPPATMNTVGQALADHDRAHAELEPRIRMWLDPSGGR